MSSLLWLLLQKAVGEKKHLSYSFEVINLRNCQKLMCQVLEQIDKMNSNKSPGAPDIRPGVSKKRRYGIAKQQFAVCHNQSVNQGLYAKEFKRS